MFKLTVRSRKLGGVTLDIGVNILQLRVILVYEMIIWYTTVFIV